MSDDIARRARFSLSRKTQLALAALMWSGVGIMLPAMGLVWCIQHYGPIGALFAAPFLAVGLLKSKVLDRISARNIEHIRTRDPEGFVLGFLPLRSWILIAGMMAMGQILRHTLFAADGPWPRAWLGFIYVAVGSALLMSSRKLWQGWREQAA